MYFIWAALIFGLAGSLHCIGMCGPLLLALQHGRNEKTRGWFKFIYHTGRILVYAMLGAIAGFVGESFVMFGFQRWLALAAGFLMLILLLVPSGKRLWTIGPMKLFNKLRGLFSSLVAQKNMMSSFVLGALNGLLPCGLVYLAMASAIGLASPSKGILFMIFFGIGTSPALLMAGNIFQYFAKYLKLKSYKSIQIVLVAVSLLIIVRGSNLGIPYISPGLSKDQQELDCCHKPTPEAAQLSVE